MGTDDELNAVATTKHFQNTARRLVPASAIEHDLDDLVEAGVAEVLDLIIGERTAGLGRVAQNLVHHRLHTAEVVRGVEGLCGEREERATRGESGPESMFEHRAVMEASNSLSNIGGSLERTYVK